MGVEFVKKPITPTKTGGVLDMLPKQGFEPEPKVEVTPKEKTPLQGTAKWGVFEGSMHSAVPLKLHDATRLYQPVHGTTASSRYFMMGGNEDLRVAARYKGNQLSIRVEGPGLQKYMSVLQDIGFSKAGSDYVSVHLACPNDMLASKALGAVLLGIGVPMLTPFPDLKVIAGKGV